MKKQKNSVFLKMFLFSKNCVTIFIIIASFLHSMESVVLDRAQLATWYPKYARMSSIDLSKRQITAIDVATFTGLTNLRSISLSKNLLTSLDFSLFNNLTNLRDLSLGNSSILTKRIVNTFNDVITFK